MPPSNRRRWGAALLLGFGGAALIALGQNGSGLDQLLPGSRKAPAAQAGGARPGSIMATTMLSMGKAGADWGSDDLRDAVAGVPEQSDVTSARARAKSRCLRRPRRRPRACPVSGQ